MKIIVRQLIYTLVFMTVIYSIFFVIARFNQEKLYPSTARQIIMKREAFMMDSKKIIFIGASNIREGFKTDEVEKFFPSWEILNLGIGGSNYTQLDQVVDVVYEFMPPEAFSKTVFVIGIWYGNVVEDQVHWKNGRTSVEEEKLRFGLYQMKDGVIVPRMPEKVFLQYVKWLQPFLVMDNFLDSMKVGIKNFFENEARALLRGKRTTSLKDGAKEEDLNAVVVEEDAKVKALQFWHDTMGREDDTVSEEQFLRLEKLVEKILEKNGKVILVDLPLPKWHSERSKHFVDYQEKKNEVNRRLKDSSQFLYINMQELNKDEDFYDSAHPKPNVTAVWSGFLAERLRDHHFISD